MKRPARNKRKANYFYRINQREDGLVDIWLTPGDAVAYQGEKGRMEFTICVLGVTGINPEDPQWGGDLEEHIRRHYAAWLDSAEVITI